MAAGVLVALDGLSGGGGVCKFCCGFFFCMALGLFVNTLVVWCFGVLVFGFNFCHAASRDLGYTIQSGQDNKKRLDTQTLGCNIN